MLHSLIKLYSFEIHRGKSGVMFNGHSADTSDSMGDKQIVEGTVPDIPAQASLTQDNSLSQTNMSVVT